MPETRPPITLAGRSLDSIAAALGQRSRPPVERWNPSHCGSSEMRILADGTWTYRGSPIVREAMIRLFSTVLRREPDGSHVLVTPVEKLSIEVELTPFRAIAMSSEGAGRDRRIAFEIDHSDAVVAGPDNPIRIVDGPAGPSPRVVVRGGLEAAIARPVYYELAEIALEEGADPPGIWSDRCFFALQP